MRAAPLPRTSLFLDEPTSGADPLARRDFWLRINSLAEKGVTIIITTHFLGEAGFCDNMLIMMDGTTLAEGSPDEIRKHAPPREDGAPASLEDAFLAITEQYIEEGRGKLAIASLKRIRRPHRQGTPPGSPGPR